MGSTHVAGVLTARLSSPRDLTSCATKPCGQETEGMGSTHVAGVLTA